MSKFNPVRSTRSLSIAAASLLLAAPVASQAHRYEAAMDSCINAFVTSSVPEGHKVTVRKEEARVSAINTHARAYKINVSAKDASSGKYLARGTCIVNRRGTVIALNGKALPAQLAAR